MSRSGLLCSAQGGKSNLVTFILSGNAFSRRWKSYRDCYSRECAKKRRESLTGSASLRKEYIYYEQLKFLGPVKHNSVLEEETETNDCDPLDLDYPEEPSAKRRKTNRTVREEVPKQKVPDPDRLFMLSLVPEMKKVPEHMKLEVKSRLLAVFTKLTSNSATNRTHRVKLPTVHVTVPVSINYESNQTQPEMVADLNDVLDPLCKVEPASDVDFESD